MRNTTLRPRRALLAGLIALFAAAAANAAAPTPKKPFDQAKMPGRWYEIARTPNAVNRDCQAGYTDWASRGGGKFAIAAVCHRGSVDGPLKTIKGDVTVLNPPQNTKVRMKVLGGLINQEYWLLDRADDYGWLIMGTPNGGFISISSRGRVASKASGEASIARARALGYDTSKLIVVRH